MKQNPDVILTWIRKYTYSYMYMYWIHKSATIFNYAKEQQYDSFVIRHNIIVRMAYCC